MPRPHRFEDDDPAVHLTVDVPRSFLQWLQASIPDQYRTDKLLRLREVWETAGSIVYADEIHAEASRSRLLDRLRQLLGRRS